MLKDDTHINCILHTIEKAFINNNCSEMTQAINLLDNSMLEHLSIDIQKKIYSKINALIARLSYKSSKLKSEFYTLKHAKNSVQYYLQI